MNNDFIDYYILKILSMLKLHQEKKNHLLNISCRG